MSTRVTISEHDTPDDLYRCLATVFGEHENNGARWVKLTVDEVEVTFFGKRNNNAETSETSEGAA